MSAGPLWLGSGAFVVGRALTLTSAAPSSARLRINHSNSSPVFSPMRQAPEHCRAIASGRAWYGSGFD